MLDKPHAPSTDKNGSYPITFIPKASAAFATRIPIAPRPTTPRVLPAISGPTKEDFPFSTSLPTSSPFPFNVPAHSMPGTILREVNNKAAITSSFTAFALAPGVLNTTIPSCTHLSTGILLVPAPARAIASRFLLNSISCIAAERTRIASGFSTSSPT